MKHILYILCLSILIIGCNSPKSTDAIHSENWSKRHVDLSSKDSLNYGKSYLSIYSQTHNLTAMASLRNVSDLDTIYLLNAKYYDTHGKLIRTYFDKPIYLAPLETTEIIIDSIKEPRLVIHSRPPANGHIPVRIGKLQSSHVVVILQQYHLLRSPNIEANDIFIIIFLHLYFRIPIII